MESPPRRPLHSRQNSDVCADEHSSPVRTLHETALAGATSGTSLSPKLMSILSEEHAQNLARIVSGAASNARPQRIDRGESPPLQASSPVNVDGADDDARLAAGDSELSVAETFEELQELVYEWEDLYFEDSDTPPSETNFHLYLWELRGRRPVPISSLGIEFGFGRVYIVLHIKSVLPSPIMTCYYWTGHKAHFSAVACAAVHAIQLSRRIGCSKTSRQMEGTETADFFDAIGKFTVVSSPTIPSLRRHIPAVHTSYAVLCGPIEYTYVEHRLAQTKDLITKRKKTDCVVADCGKHIYMFIASQKHSTSILLAMRLVQYMKRDRQGKTNVSIVDENESLEFFEKYYWSTCDTFETGTSFFEVRDKLQTVDNEANNENNDNAEVTDITSTVLSSLCFHPKYDSCYVMQCFGFAICIIGSDCSYACREVARDVANNFVSSGKCISILLLHGLNSLNHPLVLACLPPQIIEVPPRKFSLQNFRTKIICRLTNSVNTSSPSSSIAILSRASRCISLDEMIAAASSPIKQLSPSLPGTSPISTSASNEKYSAASVVSVWVFDGALTHSLSRSDYGVFEVHNLYVVQVIRSSVAKGGVFLHRLYFWIGPLLQKRASAIAKMISITNSVSAHIREGGKNCSEIEAIVFENFQLNINMCLKPLCLESSILRQANSVLANSPFVREEFAQHDALVEFCALFNGVFVVDKLSHPSYGLSMPSVALGFISGRSVSSAMCVLMKKEIRSLHSLANFCIIAPTCVLLWYGRWSDSVSRRVALDFVKCYFKNRLLRTFHEGSEPQEFFSYLEPSQVSTESSGCCSTEVRIPEYLLTAPWWVPRLFACVLDTGKLAIKPCPSLEQNFFESSSCMIVDSWVSVFVWIADDASISLVSQCITLAKNFVAGCPDRLHCPVIVEHQYSERSGFRDLFVNWNPWLKISVETQFKEHLCNTCDFIQILVNHKKQLKHVKTKESDLKMMVWDQEILARWKTFATARTTVPENPSFISSPPRVRPVFKSIRAKLGMD